MHEMSVALQIRRSLEEELAWEPGLTVVRVGVQVGALSGIVPAALEFAWPHAVVDSPMLGDSTLTVEWVDVSGRCEPCDAHRTLPGLVSLRCPVCGAPLAEITGGDELDITTVDVREAPIRPTDRGMGD